MHRRVSGRAVNKNAGWWSELAQATDLRNKLTHPKGAPVVDFKSAKRALQAIIDATNALYKAVYKKGLPASRRGLNSKLDF